ncbi:MAG: hypothetical protein F6K54_29560 [Okeania sp. SIO3B5]|nr:hypothetical protein [Okeania sp. SIO3B5]NEO56859.1 hypothetical protein [Okeania sp. SIO3B5]
MIFISYLKLSIIEAIATLKNPTNFHFVKHIKNRQGFLPCIAQIIVR